MRHVFFVILPVLLPSGLYLLWFFNARAKALADGRPEAVPKLGDAPWVLLAAAGIGLMMLGLLAIVLSGGSEPDSVYHPPEMIDGKIVPGYMTPRP